MNTNEIVAAAEKRAAITVTPLSFNAETPVSYRIGSDSYAAKIVRLGTKKGLVYSFVELMIGCATLGVERFSLRKDGRYVLVNHKHGHVVFGISKTDIDREF